MSICNRGHRLIEEQSLDPPIRRRFPKNQAHSGYKFGQNPFCKGEEMGEFTSSAFKEAFWSDEEFLSTAIDEISEPDGDDIPATGRNKNRSSEFYRTWNGLSSFYPAPCVMDGCLPEGNHFKRKIKIRLEDFKIFEKNKFKNVF
ncbi:hypothetical protein BY996DRAFT_6464660 [Phakopsora pachyrhizi]|nr:hypothetical protein BY996DRAFT_6464660 [Phakopsora pachyrhizi]